MEPKKSTRGLTRIAFRSANLCAGHCGGSARQRYTREAVSAGFRILAGYIFGDNQTQGKIGMSAPVTQGAGQRIAMTTPVEESEARAGWEIRFTMPAAYTFDDAHCSNFGLIRS